MTYFYIGAYITHLQCDHRATLVYISADQMPDDGFAIKDDSILLPFAQKQNQDWLLPLSDDKSCNTGDDSEKACIDPEQPPVRTPIYGTPHMDDRLAGKPMSNV